jgi:hypothetical protein
MNWKALYKTTEVVTHSFNHTEGILLGIYANISENSINKRKKSYLFEESVEEGIK